MKTLQDYRNDFMKEASEYDLGRKEEDFHSYLRHHNLEHHLSETQIRERNMEIPPANLQLIFWFV